MKLSCAVSIAVTLLGCADADSSSGHMTGEQTGAKPAEKTKLCDGVDELKLRIFYAPQNEREQRGSVVRVENGAPSFGVDGKCHYFISGGWDTITDVHNEPWREGQLDAATEHALEEAFPLADLSSIADCQSSAGIFDASPLVITSASSNAACIVPGPKFMASVDAFNSRRDTLWESAEPMKGALWISATEGAPASPTTTYDWPLMEPLLSYFVPLPQAGMNIGFRSGEGHAITDPAQAQKLRALRTMFLAAQASKIVARQNAPVVTDGMRSGMLYMRDALPHEDAHGLLTWEASP